MNPYKNDIVYHYIVTKNKKRKIATYIDFNCELRKLHSSYADFLNKHFTPSIFSKAYIERSSIFENAKAHMYNDYFIMLDVKDFFNNISHKLLEKRLFYELNIINENTINQAQCNKIVQICSVSARGIPLGFITSPVLSNIYMKEFDNIVYGKLKKIEHLEGKNIIYTRYADDMTISFKCEDSNKHIELECEIIKVIEEQLERSFLRLNEHKKRSYNINKTKHVKITGVNIIRQENNYRTLTVGRKTKKNLFIDAIEAFDTKNKDKCQYVKGMQSFILSVEKRGYEDIYSPQMLQFVRDRGFESLKNLIDSL